MLNRKGFTLIELLVVVTIIVVLLALLVPAMDRAIYQAELAVCGARLDAVAGGALIYASDHRRSYPVRNFYINNRDPNHLAGLDNSSGTPIAYHDERPTLKGYIGLKSLLDPMARAVELENTSVNAEVFSAYETWYGWRYVDPSTGQRQPGMHRLGDRFGWAGHRFNILAGDYDEYQLDNACVYSTHPDRDGTLAPQVLQDEGGVSGVASSLYLTRWRRQSTPLGRGLLDLNYAYDDGSVRRLTDVAFNSDPNDTDHTVAVPQYADTTLAGSKTDFTRIPPR